MLTIGISAILFLVLPTTMQAQATVTLQCAFAQGTVQIGKTVEASCVAQSADVAISAAEIHLNYPTTYLSAQQITPGVALDESLKEEILDEEGHLLFARGTFSQTLPQGDYEIFSVTFRAEMTGTAELTPVDAWPRKTNILGDVDSVLGTMEGDIIQITTLAAGDITGDDNVNVFDLQVLITMIVHDTAKDPALHPIDKWERGDLNGDGMWNVFDLQMLIGLILF
ncbi:MAG: dockerin type I domain-containing protein [Chloroflexota bacterium]